MISVEREPIRGSVGRDPNGVQGQSSGQVRAKPAESGLFFHLDCITKVDVFVPKSVFAHPNFVGLLGTMGHAPKIGDMAELAQ